ncbi:uncharacterized protein LOC111347439 [Stylophora pistillata]|uniref:SAP domain-containing protein n=1 Tax=Stylophora pistillata TaxID=50429 RepID=A0A2B4R697_STYPI|nr:uncharacterized protein LOC111336261 [Stylophora pistillata]XP_022809491.1 uncharacterized protein LOC111346472 [Stylophora pistillata]XP_022810420.1 uncharacterized protein LOC111347439 [Stylophora pistillata]PFX12333.1 hypothetical protein AWC38_SpisGene23729 [Stylophora pistillata]PFX13069.1 hypothetical protein AWC38_SpisGene22879 [Stylophora pistillata]PFX20942.1 hypothetical protein AWC38_SpisGene14596 [Stylophora pistillata]
MVDKSNATVRDALKVILTEEDIPGAKIPRETVEQCSVVQLKRWLLCRGAKTTGNKKALITRVQDYIKHGLDVKYLRDPDGGLHLLRKKAQLGVLEEEEPQLNQFFPKEGYKPDFKDLPKIAFGTVWQFMIEGVESKKQLSTAKPLVKGFNFFKSGHVLYIGHLHQNGKHYVKSQVLPSMKKDKVYSCFLLMSSIGCVLKAHCKCPAGIDGRCNHVASTLFALEQSFKETKRKNSDAAESCTSKPCKWNVPGKRKGPVTPISEMSFVKHDYAKEKKAKRPKLASCPAQNGTCVSEKKVWPSERLQNFHKSLKEYQMKSGRAVGWTHILPQKVNNLEEPLISPIKCHPISADELRVRFEKVKRNINFDEEKIKKVEEQTRGQSNSNLWHHHRQPRITATNCYRIAVQRETTSPTKIIQDVLGYKKPFQSKYMQEGLEMEDRIIAAYKLLKQGEGVTDISVEKCGFFISKHHGLLGASPDGLVCDPSAEDSKGLLEVKYIQMEKQESLEEALLRKGICKKFEESVILNSRHKYYFQVQQAMFVAEQKWTDFVVMGTASSTPFCERVYFSQEHWDRIFPKLESFFNCWIVPELSYPCVKYGLPKIDARMF